MNNHFPGWKTHITLESYDGIASKYVYSVRTKGGTLENNTGNPGLRIRFAREPVFSSFFERDPDQLAAGANAGFVE